MREEYEKLFPMGVKPVRRKDFKTNYWLPSLLFIITFFTTLLAGIDWINGLGYGVEMVWLYAEQFFSGVDNGITLSDFSLGLPYALSILFILACHEFGHYIAGRKHRIYSTLPNFIPFPPIPGILNFGTLGAVIKTKVPIRSKKALFDIGAAGPLAGFIASLCILIYGFTHLPPVDYILSIHPDYFTPEYGENMISLTFGDTLLFAFLREVFTGSSDFVPPMSEVYHYPYLITGWFGLFVTAMNLIPVGQLDGGHIAYSLFGGKVHQRIAGISMLVLIALGVLGVIGLVLDIEMPVGWPGWLFWAALLYFFIKIKHPPTYDDTPLSPVRRMLGYTTIGIFIVSFSPSPFVVGLG
jgi:membrane-associated protease RseP (regulator of RpoE activity)